MAGVRKGSTVLACCWKTCSNVAPLWVQQQEGRRQSAQRKSFILSSAMNNPYALPEAAPALSDDEESNASDEGEVFV